MLALQQRKERVAEGLAAGERGKHELELARKKALETLHEVKQQAAEIISRAEKRGADIVEEAKNEAVEEGGRVKAAARRTLEQEVNRARETLGRQVVEIARRVPDVFSSGNSMRLPMMN